MLIVRFAGKQPLPENFKNLCVKLVSLEHSIRLESLTPDVTHKRRCTQSQLFSRVPVTELPRNPYHPLKYVQKESFEGESIEVE